MAKVVTFAQQKGGSGKTTLLAHLAVALSAPERRVAVVDLDPQRTLAAWIDERIRRRETADLDLVESSEWRVGADISRASRDAELILVDCPGNADVMLNRALRETDLVIVPTQPAAPDVWATRATLRMAARQGAEARVVLNRVPPRGGGVEEMVARLEEDGAELLPERIGNRIAFATAFAEGATATETQRGSKAALEIEALAAAVLRRLG